VITVVGDRINVVNLIENQIFESKIRIIGLIKNVSWCIWTNLWHARKYADENWSWKCI